MDFENLQKRFNKAIKTHEWKQLLGDFKNCDKIYFIGNGGLSSNCSHAASDILRLSARKVFSLDNMSLFTSLANDYGYSEVFKNWLALYTDAVDFDSTIVIGMSGSGNSPNVINALHYANNIGFKTVLLSGSKSHLLNSEINEVNLDTKYFHTHEILTTMLFYELAEEAGAVCPTIKAEISRKNKERNGKK